MLVQYKTHKFTPITTLRTATLKAKATTRADDTSSVSY